MPHQILIRDVPADLRDWIDQQSHSRLMSRNSFLLAVMKKVSVMRQADFLDGDHPGLTMKAPSVRFAFSDFFSGIGGFRIGLQKAGGHCVFSCEWDRYAQKTYSSWFGELPEGDVRKIKPDQIPDHDILAAGFPCQPFSIAGVSKKKSLGRAHGFKDRTQGTLFFHLATIIELKRPPVLFLENVKNLASHDQGRTWKVIRETLEGLDYRVFHKIIDAKAYVPQHRERIYIVCFDKRVFGDNPTFEFPADPSGTPKLSGILESSVDSRYTLSDHLWDYLRKYAEKHRELGNGFGFGIASPDSFTRTLSARYYKDGSEILIARGKGKNPRRLTPRECARLMGFDDSLPVVVSDTQAYRQFGNAVVPLIVEAIAHRIVSAIFSMVREGTGDCYIKGRRLAPHGPVESRGDYGHSNL
jgi:DNA (cytosine-5)-methyltransferase 1